MSELSELREPVGNVARLAGCEKWQMVHDKHRDTYAIVMGPDTEDEDNMIAAARLALEHLE